MNIVYPISDAAISLTTYNNNINTTSDLLFLSKQESTTLTQLHTNNLPFSPRISGGFGGAAVCCPLRARAGDRLGSILSTSVTCKVTC